MAAKAILILCTQVIMAQSVFSQCTRRAAIDGSRFGAPYGLAGSYLATPGLATPGLAASGLAYAAGLACPSMVYDGFVKPGAGYAERSLAYDGLFAPAMDFTATSGGAMPVSSSSAILPNGISVLSENLYEGALLMSGELPFVGTTGIAGVLPTAGAGAINHACGNGLNAMTALSATSTPASVATIASPAFAVSGLAYDGLIAPCSAAPALAYDSLAFSDAALGRKGFAYDNLAYVSPLEAIETTPTSGGALPVSSASAVPPTGISVASDNVYEGALAVAGELPFVGTVGMEGVLPTAGAGAINHACGNGRNAMISETSVFVPAAAAYAPATARAPSFGAPAYGYRSGWAGRGCAF